MFLYVLLIGCCLHLQAAQDCSSPTFNFANHYNADKLDLTTPPGHVIARFPVANVRTVSVVSDSGYISVNLDGSELQFVTTDRFAQYEENEIQIVIILQMIYTCTTGQLNGIYRHDLKEANNHAPRFLEEAYGAIVPLPLPKHFDVSPYFAGGVGVMARDIDLVNNTVQFSISDNDYFTIESHPVAGDVKQYKAILRLRTQVLKLTDTLQLIVTATDQGVPPKMSQVTVTVEQDLSIVYDEPPVFKDTFVNGTAEKDTIISLALVPGSEAHDVRYTVQGPDAEYFSLSLWSNNSGLELSLVNLHVVPAAKAFLNVLVIAQRTEALQKTSAVILLTIPSAGGPETPETTIQKALAVLHLDEMAQHRDVYPLAIAGCVFSIDAQMPGDFFYVDEKNGTLASEPFDREDEVLFSGLDFPQFWIVLKLNCPPAVEQNGQFDPAFASDLTRLGPMRDIAYSTVLTHLNIVVRDINDNSPEFVHPPDNGLLVFPSARLARKLFPGQLIKVEAIDRDEGINAVIRYRLATNDHFGIDGTTGVIFPLKNALAKVSSTTLHIYATDRDGADDGNTSTMTIRVMRGEEDHFVAVTVQDTDPVTFEKLVQEISKNESLHVGTLKNVYSVAQDSAWVSESRSTTNEQYATQAVVYAFKGETLLAYREVVSLLQSHQQHMSLSTVNELFVTQPAFCTPSDTTVIYPYIIVAAFFGTLAIAMAAAAIYYRAKWNQQRTANAVNSSCEFSTSETASISSAATIVKKEQDNPSCTPPWKSNVVARQSDAAGDESVDSEEPTRISARTLTEPSSNDVAQQKKSIKFNEHVERIEVFDK